MKIENTIKILQERGFIEAVTDECLYDLQKPVIAYCGFDPTADSLHLGHLIPILTLAHLQRGGHKVLALVGGATGQIGDPSGRSTERNMLTLEQIDHNKEAIKRQLSTILDFEGENPAIMVDNNDWFSKINVLEWLRDVGKYFSINSMLSKDSVKKRLNTSERTQGLTYTEFSYMLLQAYDFMYLNEHYGCDLQLGGSDQWGNITAGIQLIHKTLAKQGYGLTMPLLETSTGEKFGKSAGNAIFISSNLTSSYQLYQYWFSTTDEDVERFLKLFTFLPLAEIGEIMAQHQEAPHLRVAQKRLAEEATRLLRGQEETELAQRASQILFGGQIEQLSDKDLSEIFEGVPSAQLTQDELEAGIDAEVILQKSGLASSLSEARRLIEGGGAYLNNQPLGARLVNLEDLASETMLVLRKGKKSYCLLHVVPASSN